MTQTPTPEFAASPLHQLSAAADSERKISELLADQDLPPRQLWALTLLAPQVTRDMLQTATQLACRRGFRVDRIHQLSRSGCRAVEWSLSSPGDPSSSGLKQDLTGLGCDVALQRDGPTRRHKRLLVMDMDSTLIQQEVIDELARAWGVFDSVAAITHRAMSGELQFDDSLRERVALLAGAPVEILEQVRATIEPMPGAARLVRVMKALGCKTAVVSGGFTRVTEPVRQQLGLDVGFANELEIVHGKLTGRVVGPIVNRARKAQLLEEMAQCEGIPLTQVIAVGDGANDLDMLGRAGMGVAFCAKPIVRAQAEFAVNQRDLAAILYLLGIRDADADAV